MGGARAQTAAGLAGAIGLHGALLGVLFFVDPPRPQVEPRRDPVQIKLVKRDRPEPKKPEPPAVVPEKPKPKPAVEVKKKPPEKPKIKKVKKPKQAKKPKKPPRVAKAEPPKPAPPAPKAPPVVEPKAEPVRPEPAAPPTRKARKFTVSMEATVPGGGVAVPTAPAGSAWAYGSPDGAEDAPKALGGSPDGTPDGTGDAIADSPGAPVQAAEVTVLPKLVSSPSLTEMRKLYPAQARRDGLEANVSLKILVSARGEVIRVRILKPAGNGFDEVAQRLVRQFRFEPGNRAGQAVAVWMPWTYKFRLDG